MPAFCKSSLYHVCQLQKHKQQSHYLLLHKPDDNPLYEALNKEHGLSRRSLSFLKIDSGLTGQVYPTLSVPRVGILAYKSSISTSTAFDKSPLLLSTNIANS